MIKLIMEVIILMITIATTKIKIGNKSKSGNVEKKQNKQQWN